MVVKWRHREVRSMVGVTRVDVALQEASFSPTGVFVGCVCVCAGILSLGFHGGESLRSGDRLI